MTLRNQHSICIFLLGVLPSFAAACSNSKTRTRGAEESVTSTSSVGTAVGALPSPKEDAQAPSCGREVQTHGQGYDEKARSCLWEAYQAGRAASLALTRHTIEGDPITFTLRVRSSSAIDVIEDNQDHFGARGVRNTTCSTLVRAPIVEGRSGFIVRGCRGSVETFEIP